MPCHGKGCGFESRQDRQWFVSIAGPMRSPVTGETTGSNPVRIAIIQLSLYAWSDCVQDVLKREVDPTLG